MSKIMYLDRINWDMNEYDNTNTKWDIMLAAPCSHSYTQLNATKDDDEQKKITMSEALC